MEYIEDGFRIKADHDIANGVYSINMEIEYQEHDESFLFVALVVLLEVLSLKNLFFYLLLFLSYIRTCTDTYLSYIMHRSNTEEKRAHIYVSQN